MDKPIVITRREFAKGMALAGATLGVAGGSACKTLPVSTGTETPPGKGSGDKIHRWDLGFYVNPLDPRLAERLAWLKQRGVGVIGLDGTGIKSPEVIRQVAQTLERSGLRADAIHGESAVARADDDLANLRAVHTGVLDRAAVWSVKYVVVHFRVLQVSGTNYWQRENEYIERVGLEAYDRRVAEFLAWLCEEAARRHLAIAVETVPMQHKYGHKIAEAVAMVERVGAPNLGICLDTGHIHAANTELAEGFRIAAKHLLTTHIHDNLGTHPPRMPAHKADLHWVPGLGTINWPWAIQAMEEIGFSGPAIFEGVHCGNKGGEGEWEKANDMAIANWRAFEVLAVAVKNLT